MKNTIFEDYKLKKLNISPPQYMTLITAVNENYNMQLLNLYESDIYKGIFIHINLKISIPTNGTYKQLDIHKNEEIILYAKADYPFSAPVVLFVRNDFPTNKIPHLNMGIPDSRINLLNPCLYRGNIDEWFYQTGPMAFCDRINDWFSDLVNGELINNDGFETIRYENPKGLIEADFDYLIDTMQNYDREYGACILGIKQLQENYFKVENIKYSKNLNKSILPCLFVFDRQTILHDYISKPFTSLKDLKIFPSSSRILHGIRLITSKYYEPQKLNRLKNLLIILAVKRPMQVIGGFSDFEFIAISLSYDFKNLDYTESCIVNKFIIIRSLNKKIAERLSGTENIKKLPIIMLGCGALGSKISMSLARIGYTEQHLYDNDILLPHNLIRHHENTNFFIGMYKANIMKLEIDAMINNNSIAYNENIFHVENFPDGLTIDCTASKRSLFWSLSSKKIKSPMLRTEIYLGGKLGVSLFEGKDRNPDVYDIQVSLYGISINDDIVSQWLNYKQPEDTRYHIGFGCSSDTMILDDSTINNHASIVPHLINKYQNIEKGIACLNYFNIDNLTSNKLKIYEIEPMMIFHVDEWDIHINNSLFQQIKNYSKEKLENAGLWIGNIEKHIKRITIVDTFIPEDNDRKICSVTTGKFGVQKYLKILATKTNGLLEYIGEWHTHISDDASPSEKDIKAFNKTKSDTEVFLMTIISPSDTQNYIIKRGK